MLRAEGLCKTYGGRDALRGVTFGVPAGCALALMGENGSGKSTLLRLLSGMERPDSGGIYYKGSSVLGDRAFLRRHVGYVPQEPMLDGALTVAQQLALWSAACGCTRDAESEALFGIEPLFSCRVRTLSGGEAQRVSIAMALQSKPDILLMDEATSGLDDTHVEALMRWLESHLARGGALVWATHRMEEVRRLCTVGVRLKDGQIVL
ncbi:MAG: ABC transporter ATP-binding protein [Oscillospiraceae bacterium]|nr:ABC transporter ATP-binding protein [Oscillospiraceae bacterium]